MTLRDRDERTLEAWLRDTAAPIPAEALDAALTAIVVTPQSRSGWRAWPRIEIFRLAGLAAAVALATLAGLAFMRTWQPGFAPGAVPVAPSGFAGTWVTMDCAQWWQGGSPVDCSRWGDSSELRLTIGAGTEPSATYDDSSALCAARPEMSPRFTASGTGTFKWPHLWLMFTSTGCSSFGNGGDGQLQLYRDPGSDTLWEDEDGDDWGLIWRRAP